MKNISFWLTKEQFLDGSKDVTRRLGWIHAKEGDRVMACEKCQGLGRGGEMVRFGPIEWVNVRREKLSAMITEAAYGQVEARREGFPQLTGEEFVKMFCRHMKCDPGDLVTRLEFKRVLPPAGATIVFQEWEPRWPRPGGGEWRRFLTAGKERGHFLASNGTWTAIEGVSTGRVAWM